MIDTELVKKAVALMGGFDDKEIETYSQFILAASLRARPLWRPSRVPTPLWA